MVDPHHSTPRLAAFILVALAAAMPARAETMDELYAKAKAEGAISI